MESSEFQFFEAWNQLSDFAINIRRTKLTLRYNNMLEVLEPEGTEKK